MTAHTLLAAAAALWVALAAGGLAARVRLPRVTGYLVAGLAVGPSLSAWLGYPALLNPGDLGRLSVLSDIALALIMLTIGMHFRAEHLRRWRQRILVVSGCETGATLALVAGATAALNYLSPHALPAHGSLALSSARLGLFLGIVAVATAPAATLLVMREYGSEGPVTDSAVTLVGLNNLFTILAYNVASHLVLAGQGTILSLLGRLLMPLGIGGLTGLAVSLWAERLEAPQQRQLLLLGGAIGVMAACRLLDIDPLLGCFACGALVAAASPRELELVASLRQVDYPLYTLFFVLAGAGLHLDLLLRIGLLGGAYVVMRTAGKLAGCWLGTRLAGLGAVHRRWTGPVMLAQAGVAIGISGALRQAWPEGGEVLQTVVLGAVVVFELLGPVAVRAGLVQAGEVPVLALLARHAPTGAFEGLHHVVAHFRASLGLPRGHRLEDAGDILVEHVMRKNVETIPHDASFHDLLHRIAHSRYDRFPVRDAQGRFAGVIAYADIRDVIVDPQVSHLLIALDLVQPEPLSVRPQQTLREVLELFREHPDTSYLPVLATDQPDRLVGILCQNDVLAAFRRLRRRARR
ncbi:MAG: cation:proton antiporter [Candidatus Latescibacterota bacterium]